MAAEVDIDWTSSDSVVLANKAYSPQEKAFFSAIVTHTQEQYSGHLWLATSGSTVQKWVGLSKGAILASAAAVNLHLKSNKSDRWVVTLPSFHVGGLGVWARAYLSGAAVYDFKEAFPGKWRAEPFYNYLNEVAGTLTSLVPAQLHDLIRLAYPSPPSLRAVVIGGGRLDTGLYLQAKALGWPVLPSYGMTECASQIATAPLDSIGEADLASPPLQLLSHLEAREQEGVLHFKGTSLLSAYAIFTGDEIQVVDPKQEGWLIAEDRGRVVGRELIIHGRLSNFIKIGGESVDIDQLEAKLQQFKGELGIDVEVTLTAFPDSRLGHVVHLAVEGQQISAVEQLVSHFNAHVLPFERIRGVHALMHFPRSPLGKIIRKDLLATIENPPRS